MKDHRPTDAHEALARLEQHNAEQRRELEALRAALAERDGHIAALRGSLSWKLTAPVRFAAGQAWQAFGFLRGVKGLLDQVGGLAGLVRTVRAIAARDGWGSVWLHVNRAMHKAARRGKPAVDPWGAATGFDLAQKPVISVLMPTYNTPAKMLDEAILSVRRQTYPHWELVAVDDASSVGHVREVLEKHAAEDERIKLAFRRENGNISAALNDAMALASGDFMTVLDHDDLLDPKALYGVARTVAEHPDVDYIYSDEDKVSADGATLWGPFYKPDWSPEYLHSMMYTCHLGAYRLCVARAIGGYRSEFDSAQDYDFTLRFLLRTQNVRHIPRVLYHWRVWEQSTAQSIDAKPQAEMRARQALEEYLRASGENFVIGPGPLPGHHEVRFLPRGEPLVSIVIPTANRTIQVDGRTEWHIDAVTESIIAKSTYRHYEIVVIHNGDLREDQVRRLAQHSNVTLVHYQAANFSLAEKINLGCARARGEYLLILNDDIRVVTPDWLERMLGMAQRPGVGAVGPKLLFPDDRIQHAGVVILQGCPGHAYYRYEKDAQGYALGAMVARNVIGVTGACLMVARRTFDEAGGFSQRYPMNYNDIDFCLKLHERGYRQVYLPSVVLYHYEGVSREGGTAVRDTELRKFFADWGKKLAADPYYNPNLDQDVPYRF